MKWMTLALVSALTACGASSPAPNSQTASASGVGAPTAAFGSYQTFSFAPANPPKEGEITARSLEVQRKLMPLVQASLEKRGYALKEEMPDLLIKITAAQGEFPGEKTQHGNPEEPVPAGFIGVDAYDRSTGNSVWHGSAQAEIDPQKINDSLLAAGVEKMLADFPTRATAPVAQAQ